MWQSVILGTDFNKMTPTPEPGVGGGIGRPAKVGLSAGVCFGASVVWSKHAVTMGNSDVSTYNPFISVSPRCRWLQFDYENGSQPLFEGKNDETRVYAAVATYGGAAGGHKVFERLGGNFESLAADLFGHPNREGVWIFKIGGQVGQASGAHWMAYRRLPFGGPMKRFEFFDANRGCYRNHDGESLKSASKWCVDYLNHYYNGGNNGLERFTNYCVAYWIVFAK